MREIFEQQQLENNRATLSIMLADRASGKRVREEDILRWTQLVRQGEDSIRELQSKRHQKALLEIEDKRRRDERLLNTIEKAKQRLVDQERARASERQEERVRQQTEQAQAAQNEAQWWLHYLIDDITILLNDISTPKQEAVLTEDQLSSLPLNDVNIKILQTNLVLLNESDAENLPTELFLAYTYLMEGDDENRQFTLGALFDQLDPENYPSKRAFRAAASAPNFMPALECALNPWPEKDLTNLYLEYEHPDFVEFGEINWTRAEGRYYAFWYDRKRECSAYLVSKTDGSVESKTYIHSSFYNQVEYRNGSSYGTVWQSINQLGNELASLRFDKESYAVTIYRISFVQGDEVIKASKKEILLPSIFKFCADAINNCQSMKENCILVRDPSFRLDSILRSSKRYSRNFLFLHHAWGVQSGQHFPVDDNLQGKKAREESKIRILVLDADTGEVLAQLPEKSLRQILGPLPLRKIDTPQSIGKEVIIYSDVSDIGVLTLDEQDRFIIVVKIEYKIDNEISEKKGLAALINKWINGSEKFEIRIEYRVYIIDFCIKSFKFKKVVDITDEFIKNYKKENETGYYYLHPVGSEIQIFGKTDHILRVNSKTLQPLSDAESQEVLSSVFLPLKMPKSKLEPVTGIPFDVIAKVASGEYRLVRPVK
jgi:hypothetical protein